MRTIQLGENRKSAVIELSLEDMQALGCLYSRDPAQELAKIIKGYRDVRAHVITESGPVKILTETLKQMVEYSKILREAGEKLSQTREAAREARRNAEGFVGGE